MSNGSVIWTDMHGHKNADNLKGVHLFERVGLGKAPFTMVGYGEHVYQACPGAPIQPGTSCMYCGTGCRYVANILSIDGQKFHVGLDCVMRTGDGGLVQNIKRSAEYRKIQREKRHALDARKAEEIEQILVRMEADEKLSHSASHFRYRLGWCGAAGRARILKELREFQFVFPTIGGIGSANKQSAGR